MNANFSALISSFSSSITEIYLSWSFNYFLLPDYHDVLQAYDQHLNMILGDVEEIVTTVEIDDETYEEIVRVCSFSCISVVCNFVSISTLQKIILNTKLVPFSSRSGEFTVVNTGLLVYIAFLKEINTLLLKCLKFKTKGKEYPVFLKLVHCAYPYLIF